MCGDALILRFLNEPQSLKYWGKEGKPFREFITNKGLFFSQHKFAKVESLAVKGITNEDIPELSHSVEGVRNAENFNATAGHLTEVYAWLHEYVRNPNGDKYGDTGEFLFQAGFALDSFFLSLSLIEGTYTHYCYDRGEQLAAWFDCLSHPIAILKGARVHLEKYRSFDPVSSTTALISEPI